MKIKYPNTKEGIKKFLETKKKIMLDKSANYDIIAPGVRTMQFISQPPRLVGRGQWGIWRVTVTYQNGHTHSADYEAFTIAEAKRRYLMEFGRVHGEIHAEIIQKVLDKSANI